MTVTDRPGRGSRPGRVREIALAPADDGRPDPSGRPAMLRTAHTQAQAYRNMRQPVPTRLALLEREYYRWRKSTRRAEVRADAAA